MTCLLVCMIASSKSLYKRARNKTLYKAKVKPDGVVLHLLPRQIYLWLRAYSCRVKWKFLLNSSEERSDDLTNLIKMPSADKVTRYVQEKAYKDFLLLLQNCFVCFLSSPPPYSMFTNVKQFCKMLLPCGGTCFCVFVAQFLTYVKKFTKNVK